jgi:hypothetical protein
MLLLLLLLLALLARPIPYPPGICQSPR